MLRTIMFLLAAGWTAVEADAQPVHPAHRAMVAEHAALGNVAAAIGGRFRAVYIREVDVPDTVRVGDESLYSVTPNVETATLPLYVRWDFGDGHTAEGMHVRRAYERPGRYEVTVTVSNRRSDASRSFDVVVRRE